MKSEDLITILAQAPRASPPIPLAAGAMVLVVGAALLITSTLGIRPDIATAITTPHLIFKMGFLATLLACAVALTRQAAKPAGRAPVAIAIYYSLWAVLAIAAVADFIVNPADAVASGILSRTGAFCVGFVFLYGLVAMGAMTCLVRQYAPTDLPAAGRLIGLTAAAAGALGYAIHCPMDNAAYILFAYGTPMLALTLLGRWVLPRFLAW